MNIHFTKSFKKAYIKRIQQQKNVVNKFEERYDLFAKNPSHETLDDHGLSGKMRGYRAFSVTGDVRVVYYVSNEIAYFIDIGTHNQVYGK